MNNLHICMAITRAFCGLNPHIWFDDFSSEIAYEKQAIGKTFKCRVFFIFNPYRVMQVDKFCLGEVFR
jgi:hypothetical protein